MPLPLSNEKMQAALYYARKRRRARQDAATEQAAASAFADGNWADTGVFRDSDTWDDGE